MDLQRRQQPAMGRPVTGRPHLGVRLAGFGATAVRILRDQRSDKSLIRRQNAAAMAQFFRMFPDVLVANDPYPVPFGSEGLDHSPFSVWPGRAASPRGEDAGGRGVGHGPFGVMDVRV